MDFPTKYGTSHYPFSLIHVVVTCTLEVKTFLSFFSSIVAQLLGRANLPIKIDISDQAV